MEIKFTPWRMAYLRGPQAEGCILCQMPAESDDERNLIVFRGERCFIVLNRYPYNNGHVMVAPFAHTADLGALEAETANELMSLTQRCVRALQQVYSPQGFNLGMNLGRVAGAGVADHLHMHVVPRWEGDLSFMPLVGGTKTIPETLEDSYATIRQALLDLAPSAGEPAKDRA